MELKENRIYRHYKGGEYELMTIGELFTRFDSSCCIQKSFGRLCICKTDSRVSG